MTDAKLDPDGLTKNQHFISQIEQRLNALNPSARPENQRIYEFEIFDCDRHQVKQIGRNGRAISATPSMSDLFSFDVRDHGMRTNFERAFATYEAQIGALTARLLQAHADRSSAVGQEVFDLFVAKMVNFIRNPYSVPKVLNTFGILAKCHPTEPAIYAAYERVLAGRKPQQAYLCRTLGITDEQYGAWLRVLFMLLTPLVDGSCTLLVQTMRDLFLDQDHILRVALIGLQGDHRILRPISQEIQSPRIPKRGHHPGTR